jgi:hypothetical protein
MKAVDGFERYVLFAITRVFSLFLIIIFFAVIVLGFQYLRQKEQESPVEPTAVSAQEVRAAIPAPKIEDQQSEDTGKELAPAAPLDPFVSEGLKLPESLASHLTPSGRNSVFEWVDSLPRTDRQEALDELSKVLDDQMAKSSSHEDANAVLNKYQEIKRSKIQARDEAISVRTKEREIYAAGAMGCIALIAMFSLVLVLLAIERNTRGGRSQVQG